MHYRSFSRKRNINTLVTVTVTGVTPDSMDDNTGVTPKQRLRVTIEVSHLTVLMTIQVSHLDKEWNAVETADDDAVVNVTCQDVKCSNGSFNQLLHTYAVDIRALCQAIGTQLKHTHEHIPYIKG